MLHFLTVGNGPIVSQNGNFRITLIALFSLMLVVSHAQSVDIPREEFLLSLSNSSLEIRKGDTLSVDLFILKSKDYKNGKADMGLSSGLPHGISLQFSPDKGIIDKSVVRITADQDVIAGKYHLILNSTIRRRTKGIILTLVVR